MAWSKAPVSVQNKSRMECESASNEMQSEVNPVDDIARVDTVCNDTIDWLTTANQRTGKPCAEG